MRQGLALLGVALTATSLPAQEHTFLTATEYSIATPLGDAQRFGPDSWSGANWEIRWMYRGRASVGIMGGFNEFYTRANGTTTFPAGAVTGDQYRHLLSIPVLLTGALYIGKYDDPRWYVGAGLGTQYTEQSLQLGLDLHQKTSWGLTAVPEVGLAFQAWYDTGGIVALRYHMPTASSAFLGNGRRRFPYVSLSMGIGYR
jgi:hypothetical protein